MSSYYNTTELTREDKIKYTSKAKAQESEIRSWFLHTNNENTPSEIWEKLFDKKIPITSVRRAMTNLTNGTSPFLKKTAKKRNGFYGKPEHVWKIYYRDEKQVGLF